METNELFIVNVAEIYHDGSIRASYGYPFANLETAMVYYVQMCKHQYKLDEEGTTHFERLIHPADGTTHRAFHVHFANGARMEVSLRSYKQFKEYGNIFLNEPSEKRIQEAQELLDNPEQPVVV